MNATRRQITAIVAGIRANNLYAHVAGDTDNPTIQLFRHPADRYPVMSVELINKTWVIGNRAEPVLLALTASPTVIVNEIVTEWEAVA